MANNRKTKRLFHPRWRHCQNGNALAEPTHGDCKICTEARPGRYRTAYGLACTRCYRVVLQSVECSNCRIRKARAKRDDPAPCCTVCLHRRLVAASACARCGNALKQVEQWTRDGPICSKCYQRERPAKRCGHCGEQRRSVRMRSRYGNGRPICHVCVYKRLPRCQECKLRFRPASGADEATTCPECLSGRRCRVRCPCGAWTRQFSRTPALCVNCRLKAKVVSKTRDRLLKGLQQEWVRNLFAEYSETLCSRCRWANRIPMSLRADFDIFAGMDRAFLARSQVDECSLAGALGPSLFRHRTRLLRWMVSRSLIGPLSSLDREWALLPWRLKALTENSPQWIKEAINVFHQDIVCERNRFVRKHHRRTRSPLKARSALLNLRAARDFLVAIDKSGVGEVAVIRQDHVDHYAASHHRPLNELGRFIRFLNQRTTRFRSLSLSRPRKNSGLVRPVTSERFDDLLAYMLQPRSHIELRYMLISLFCLLYAQYPKTAVALRCEQVRETSDGWEFRAAKVWLSIPEPMGALLSRWQSSRREQSVMDVTGSSAFLFPGLRASNCVSTDSFNGWLAERGIRSSQMFVSGFANLCRHGLMFASVARDAYGVNPATAVRYLSQFHPAKSRVAAREVHASATKRKRTRSK